MNNIITHEEIRCIAEALKGVDIKIRLEQWPCTVAILGVCATLVAMAWINNSCEQCEE